MFKDIVCLTKSSKRHPRLCTTDRRNSVNALARDLHRRDITSFMFLFCCVLFLLCVRAINCIACAGNIPITNVL